MEEHFTVSLYNMKYKIQLQNLHGYFPPLTIYLLICVYRRVNVQPCPASILCVFPVTRACLSFVYSRPVVSLIVFPIPQFYYHGLTIPSLSSQACY